MKYLIVVLVLVVFAWIVLRGSAKTKPRSGRRDASANGPEAMVTCQHCGIHLPPKDAVEDARGTFCSEAHRLAGPRTNA